MACALFVSGSACVNFEFSEKENLGGILEYVQVFGWVSRIDIALDVADNTLFELDYFIQKAKRWNLLVKSAVLTLISEKDRLIILSVKLFTLEIVGLMQGLKVISICVLIMGFRALKTRGPTPTQAQVLKVKTFEISIGEKKKTETLIVSEYLL